MQVIAIDLGSNTLRVIKYDCIKNIETAHFQKTVRTAQSLNSLGIIDKNAQERIIKALLEAKRKINFDNCKILAYTTEALRAAKNSSEVLNNIKNNTNIEFKIIDGKTEAILTLNAVKNRLNSLNIFNDFVLIDIGGGSTEISFFIDNKIYSKSFKIGIVTVATKAKNLNDINLILEEKFIEIKNFTKNFDTKNLILVATAGTPTTVAAMKLNMTYETYDAKKINGTKLQINELDIYLNKLLNMSKKEREIVVGVGRDDLIVAGILIFKKLFEILNKKESIVIDDGLVQGIALKACES
jgi:exopolyphosphatase/guanosine-5'-triphosphate,3'-diphosphate pyrophosphatase